MRILHALLLFVWLCLPAAALAQTATGTVSAVVGSIARLELSPTSIQFPDADPDTVPFVAALPGPITISTKARASDGATILLTIQASDVLRSGVNVISESNISWTATGAGFLPGTLSRQAVTVATFAGSGFRTGTQSLRFRNLWTHPAGNYSLSLQYTLTAP
jgi:hypothetical protein